MATATYDTGIYDTDVYGEEVITDAVELRALIQEDRLRVYVGSKLLIDVRDVSLIRGATKAGMYSEGSADVRVDDAYLSGV